MKLWDLTSPLPTCLLPAAGQEKQETALQYSSLHAYQLQNMRLLGFTKLIFPGFNRQWSGYWLKRLKPLTLKEKLKTCDKIIYKDT